ncbi:uncharacterized protein LOC126896167 isoform X1 [Daktulosphaira vitifoliae]|uniref:uncharacterized protein LOC126896167 isoform X1 n=2 Tax=Daktulosphaira vitifoliae TaxID=58002 RepID=UPI0021AA52E9|nr:uncharacterized protein LOC126896167 isoform X1 [Daktulosphaira vitifoliae]
MRLISYYKFYKFIIYFIVDIGPMHNGHKELEDIKQLSSYGYLLFYVITIRRKMSISFIALLFLCVVNEISSDDIDDSKEEEVLKNLTKIMAYTNCLLMDLNNNDLYAMVPFMIENTGKTFEELEIYFVPPIDDITSVAAREQVIQDNLGDFYCRTGLDMIESEKCPKDVETTLYKEYQNRYILMKEIYNIFDYEIEDLNNNELIDRKYSLECKDNENSDCNTE